MTRLMWPELLALGILAILTLHLTAVGGPLVGLAALGVLVLAARCFIADAQVDEALARLDAPLGDVIDGHTGGRPRTDADADADALRHRYVAIGDMAAAMRVVHARGRR